ncbi:uncharacterized protein LOC125478498 [Pyrus x bretschneideri]|uniref:uncharacterized protein LOC125478498 n=1 Tax=Pyrus x bretschneideri TaxID=225117 RepID=UPI00202DC17B|nr:uncharacterized protein LOC125478498 [Pyrus x bretschneideri]
MITLSGDIDISVAISETDLVKQLLLRHQLLPPEIRHVVRPLEYEHLIPQEPNGSQSGAKGVSCYEHGTINIAHRWGNFICVGVDSKLTDALTGHVTDLTCNKFYRLSHNIYITMAGFRMAWEEMWQWITSVVMTNEVGFQDSAQDRKSASRGRSSPNGCIGLASILVNHETCVSLETRR